MPTAIRRRTLSSPLPVASSVGLWLLLYFLASAGISSPLRAATPSPSESSDDGDTEALTAASAVGGD